MPVFNANMRFKCVCRISEITQFLFCNLHMYVYIVLTKTVETLHKPHSLLLFHFLTFCAFYQSLIYRRKDWRKQGLEGKRTLGFPIFLSPMPHLQHSGRLIQGGNGSKRGCDRNPWSFVFLRKTLVRMESMASWSCSLNFCNTFD